MRAWILVLTMLLTGCSSITAGVAARSDRPELRIDSSSVAREVTIERVQKRYVGDRLQASAVLASRVSTDRYLQYKFTFYDIDGIPLEPETMSWRPINLHGGEQRPVTAVAPLPTATEFEIYVRRATDE
ncbi:YcfL family protein [Ferrimonas balearica]|uniref:YcfL family protein n=1 Tax=Ferrimonas balearica TaxID=44012 RepID=UPI001C992A7F|nr:YcfL family protein [Ferrimonas balearica]MBY5991261.1 YcfL family protein [Ferrimonas balearica]